MSDKKGQLFKFSYPGGPEFQVTVGGWSEPLPELEPWQCTFGTLGQCLAAMKLLEPLLHQQNANRGDLRGYTSLVCTRSLDIKNWKGA